MLVHCCLKSSHLPCCPHPVCWIMDCFSSCHHVCSIMDWCMAKHGYKQPFRFEGVKGTHSFSSSYRRPHARMINRVFPWKILWKRLNFFFDFYMRRGGVWSHLTKLVLSHSDSCHSINSFVTADDSLSSLQIWFIAFEKENSVYRRLGWQTGAKGHRFSICSQKKTFTPFPPTTRTYTAGMGIKGGKDSGLTWIYFPLSLIVATTHTCCILF